MREIHHSPIDREEDDHQGETRKDCVTQFLIEKGNCHDYLQRTRHDEPRGNCAMDRKTRIEMGISITYQPNSLPSQHRRSSDSQSRQR